MDHLMIIWWSYDYYIMITEEHLRILLSIIWRCDELMIIINRQRKKQCAEYLTIIWIQGSSADNFLTIVWSYDDHLMSIWLSDDDHVMIIWWSLQKICEDYHVNIIWWCDHHVNNIWWCNNPMIIANKKTNK